MLTSPLASLAGWSWSRSIATDLPKALRRIYPPSAAATPGPGASPASQQWAVQGSGPATALRFAAAGRWHHAQAQASSVHWLWGSAADLALFPSLRTRLPLGNPLIAIRFEDAFDAHDETGEAKGVTRGSAVELGNGPVMVSAITVLAFAPSAPSLDSIGVLRYLSDALTAAVVTSGAPAWQEFVDAFASIEQPLRILEPGGSPATGRSFSLGRSATPLVLQAAHLGDALTALGISRASLVSGSTLDVAQGDEVVATASNAPFPAGVVSLSSTTSHVTVAPLDAWFAPQGSAALQRFTRGNTVLAFADGAATFKNLFAELTAAVAHGAQGAFYVTGYSLQHDVTLGPAEPQAALRTVQEVATAMGAAGGDARFLALQMLQLNPSWVRTVESTAALAGLLLSIGGAVATYFQDDQSPDQMSFFLHSQAIAYALMVGSASLDSVLEGFELNRGAIDALHALPGVEAHLDPVDADVDDNPHATHSELVGLALPAQRRFNVFHQKIQIVRNMSGLHAYCGGIDLNANRTQDRDHASRGPFHDVHARVNGLAAGELATTFIERWRNVSTTTLALDSVGALDELPEEGPDVVQVARTYYGAVPGSGRGFTQFAPNGERTILDTLLQAIGRARRHIYIEDQYLTPPAEFAFALAAAAARVSGPLVIIVPSTTDQPFGLTRRQAFIQQLHEAWGDRFKVGILRKRFSRTQTTFTSAKGRLWLSAALGDADNIVEIGPVNRLPDAPFWLVVDGEAMRAYQKVSGYTSATGARYYVDRAEDTNLFKKDSGSKRASHKSGAAAVTGLFPSVYVHSKMVLIDDAFASIGSANCNRRGYYSDGECNIFAMRDTIADGDDNWIRNLRVDLWAEHLGVTEAYGRVALRDPVASLPLFDRKFTTGNRFPPVDAQPYSTDFALATEFIDTTSAIGGVAMIGTLVAGIGTMLAGSDSDAIFDTVVDPGSQVE
ncbi:MAG: phospholipase D-like domain-containing protein [Gemmatimonadaceae bacterium]